MSTKSCHEEDAVKDSQRLDTNVPKRSDWICSVEVLGLAVLRIGLVPRGEAEEADRFRGWPCETRGGGTLGATAPECGFVEMLPTLRWTGALGLERNWRAEGFVERELSCWRARSAAAGMAGRKEWDESPPLPAGVRSPRGEPQAASGATPHSSRYLWMFWTVARL